MANLELPYPHRARRALAALLVGAVGLIGSAALAGCGDDADEQSDRTGRTATKDRQAGAFELPILDPSAFVGKTEAEATAAARKQGLEARVVARDGQPMMVTGDYRPLDRVNFVVVGDVVVQAYPG